MWSVGLQQTKIRCNLSAQILFMWVTAESELALNLMTSAWQNFFVLSLIVSFDTFITASHSVTRASV
jgi:hypothetical protein